MAVGSGPTQVPVLAIPHTSEGKSEFETSRRYDLSYKGFLGVVAFGAVLAVFILLLRTDYWYVGAALLILIVVFFSSPLIRGNRPR
jgi:hypothetical protein